MRADLSYILDYCIETNNISVVNTDLGSVYMIPYDGSFFDELLATIPHEQWIEVASCFNEDIDNLKFTLICGYSHVGADNRLKAKYELSLEDTVLWSEFATISDKKRPGRFSLLRAARKCSAKIIAQERMAMKRSMVKTLRNGKEYDS